MLRKNKKSLKIAPKDRTGVLLEDIDKKFDLVLEGHEAIREEMKDFRYETRSELKFIRFAQDVLQNQVGDLKLGMKQVMEYLKRIDDEIQDLKVKLSNKADLERLAHLEQRVVQIEMAVKKFRTK